MTLSLDSRTARTGSLVGITDPRWPVMIVDFTTGNLYCISRSPIGPVSCCLFMSRGFSIEFFTFPLKNVRILRSQLSVSFHWRGLIRCLWEPAEEPGRRCSGTLVSTYHERTACE